MKAARDTYFLDYQRAWLADQSRYKIAEKSRRVGLTYAQSYEDVRDAARAENPMDVWFSSADESAAKEYIRYCAQWAKILHIGATDLGEQVLDEEKGVKALVVEFANGKRIHALTSNPKAFRSKGGKLVLDEFAFHGDPEAMWKAARPIITWGYPVRIISTYNGKGNLYFRMVDETKKATKAGRQPLWSLHSIPIQRAVADGLADKITGRRLSAAEREAWLENERQSCGSEDVWKQEYCCEPLDEATAWLSYELIARCESDQAGLGEAPEGVRGERFVGMDIARRRDLTIIWVNERVGDVDWTLEVVSLPKAKFAEQYAEFDRVMDFYNPRRACLDQTGMGEVVVEQMKTKYGEQRIEGVLFGEKTKHELATLVKQRFEDVQVRIPVDKAIREGHHAVRKLTTIAGNARFDAVRTEAGHADEFWAHALALHAADEPHQPPAGEEVEAAEDTYAPEAGSGRPRSRMFERPADRAERAVGPLEAPGRSDGSGDGAIVRHEPFMKSI